MPWTQKQMLRDANGDLIPQYWDVVEQEFKPLTGRDGANDVRLTGSYVEYNAAQRNFSITAGASKTIEFIFDRNVEAFVITLYKPQAHTTSKPTYMFRFGSYGAPAFSVELPLLNENTSRGFTSKKIDVLHNRAIMILSNNDTSDQNYSVFVTLFKKSLDGSVTISEI